MIRTLLILGLFFTVQDIGWYYVEEPTELLYPTPYIGLHRIKGTNLVTHKGDTFKITREIRTSYHLEKI